MILITINHPLMNLKMLSLISLEMLDKALVTALIQRRLGMPRAPAAIALIHNVQAEGASASLPVATGMGKKHARCHFVYLSIMCNVTSQLCPAFTDHSSWTEIMF
ncbi:UNVERIFIED_CONTAM: hypothetical protein FKN15_020646 [Acipenser sinensis]